MLDIIALSTSSSVAQRVYHHHMEGWKVIGGVVLDPAPGRVFASAADYYRAGPKAFLKVRSLLLESAGGGISSVQARDGALALALNSFDDTAGPAGESSPTGFAGLVFDSSEGIVGPGGEVIGPGPVSGGGGGTVPSPTPSSTQPTVGQGGGLVGPTPEGIAFEVAPVGGEKDTENLGSPWTDVIPVLVEHELSIQDGRIRMTFHWDSEVGRRYALEFRSDPAEAWEKVGQEYLGSERAVQAEADITTDGGEFRVVEILNPESGS